MVRPAVSTSPRERAERPFSGPALRVSTGVCPFAGACVCSARPKGIGGVEALAPRAGSRAKVAITLAHDIRVRTQPFITSLTCPFLQMRP